MQRLEELNAFCIDCAPIAAGRIPKPNSSLLPSMAKHLAMVNGIDAETATQTLTDAYNEFEELRQVNWIVDRRSIDRVISEYQTAIEPSF